MNFPEFNKIARLKRDCVVTEKLDGTNGLIFICGHSKFIDKFDLSISDENRERFLKEYCLGLTNDGLYMFAGSRTRWITPEKDNYGFAAWVTRNSEELFKLGEGHHYGEWYGNGIQRKYDLKEKRFALFNARIWDNKNVTPRLLSIDRETNEEKYSKECPSCCEVVPVLWEGIFDTNEIELVLHNLKVEGSKAVPGFMNPEGIVIYHTASGKMYKQTIDNDEKPKSKAS